MPVFACQSRVALASACAFTFALVDPPPPSPLGKPQVNLPPPLLLLPFHFLHILFTLHLSVIIIHLLSTLFSPHLSSPPSVNYSLQRFSTSSPSTISGLRVAFGSVPRPFAAFSRVGFCGHLLHTSHRARHLYQPAKLAIYAGAMASSDDDVPLRSVKMKTNGIKSGENPLHRSLEHSSSSPDIFALQHASTCFVCSTPDLLLTSSPRVPRLLRQDPSKCRPPDGQAASYKRQCTAWYLTC